MSHLTAKQREKEFLLNLEENKKSTKDLDIVGYSEKDNKIASYLLTIKKSEGLKIPPGGKDSSKFQAEFHMTLFYSNPEKK